MISITGIGWINQQEYGCVMMGIQESYAVDALPKKKIFSHAFKNFGRLDSVSKMTCSAIALALKDAGIDCPPESKRDIGTIGSGSSGSLQSDLDYFRDYLDSGRTLSRGNLFIYTLPSSPAGEAAIHFGLQGPVFYIAGPGNSVATALRTASEIILNNEASVMLAGMTGPDSAVYFVLKKTSDAAGDVLCSYDYAMKVMETNSGLDDMVREFLNSMKGSVV
ncbi:MAG: hypothetical protein C4560_13245 [Nitrospiraceae bacterium]|nr:MAG: hypothetical protein C4560_13245 [Nitrospiraceae bacterium]